MKITVQPETDKEKELIKEEIKWEGVRNFILSGQSSDSDIKFAHGSPFQNLMEAKAILTVVETDHENKLSVAREVDKIKIHMQAQETMAASAAIANNGKGFRIHR